VQDGGAVAPLAGKHFGGLLQACSDLLWETDSELRVIQTYIPKGANSSFDYQLFLGRRITKGIQDSGSSEDQTYLTNLSVP
jgi:hypothetical protein